MNLTNSQERVVNSLLNKTIESIETNKISSVYFKAPTGSGKTFMMINYIDKLIEWNKLNFNDNLVFVIVTLSSAELPKQMEENFNEYKHYLSNNDLKITRIESPSNINKNSKVEKNYQFFAKPNNVYIMGGASFRNNSILREQGAIEAFLGEIRLNDYKLIYIRDEAHIGADTNKKTYKDEANFEQNMQKNAHFIVKMTATPDDNSINLIELSEKELANDNIKLLKSEKVFNEGINNNNEIDNIDNETILEQACLKFKQIKEEYNNSEKEPGLVGIDAAMLIQIDNTSKDIEKEAKFKETLELIIKKLNEHNLSWVKYFDQNDKESNLRMKENYSLRDISKNNSAIDVIIFKVGPATGWNIPRACMIVQLRNVSSKNLSIQTIGRIKRNPNPSFNFMHNSIANKYFIYSNVDREVNDQKTLFLKDDFKSEEFVYGSLKNIKSNSVFNIESYEKDILDEIDHYNLNYFEMKMEEINYEFSKNNFIVADKKSYGNKEFIDIKLLNKIQIELYNIKQLKLNEKFLTKNIMNKLNDFYNLNLKNKIDNTLFWFIMIKNKFNYFKEKYNKNIQNQLDQNEIEYRLEKEKYLPEYLIAKITEKNSTKTNQKFAYREFNNEMPSLNIDSEAEKEFVKELDYLIRKMNKDKDNIKIWTKNPTYNGVNFEYFFKSINGYEIANSYPDFLIKHNNHFIYLEVKTYNNDIDENKTLLLWKEYKKYIQQNKNSKINLTLAIALVDVKNELIYIAGSSTIKELDNELSNTNPNEVSVHDKIKSKSINDLQDLL
ncbi:Type III restriction enzyme, res subunit [Mycoplasmopsis maculosa]|uniref:Type III restriction enzyme, res subunit n=1 Tax=Mycoplasmopsis maculosa TaxID=114885 RepID=A0A449B4L0_9BACT|nr:DEAD/DEAH box helicase family protein [Mycoplasmopsis maculosa]VEU75537.1 Type III restriction enzyme, res subunit [Mycoplasmopsis maculosa]